MDTTVYLQVGFRKEEVQSTRYNSQASLEFFLLKKILEVSKANLYDGLYTYPQVCCFGAPGISIPYNSQVKRELNLFKKDFKLVDVKVSYGLNTYQYVHYQRD